MSISPNSLLRWLLPLVLLAVVSCSGGESPEDDGKTPSEKVDPGDDPGGDEPEPDPEDDDDDDDDGDDGDDPAWEFYREATDESSAHCTRVYEFTPAPGQFVNSGYDAGTADEANAYAFGELSAGRIVSLGGWGGTLVVGFDHSILDVEGADIAIGGNAMTSSSEPGIVRVARDANGNGVPDDEWYELAGSQPSQTGYEITYHRENAATGEPVRWEDNLGASGTVETNPYHTQSYYPAWIEADSYTLRGSLLPSNVVKQGAMWIAEALDWGYADNFGSDYTDGEVSLDLANAVSSDGVSVELGFVDFVKIQTAVNAVAGATGEISTEVTGIRDI